MKLKKITSALLSAAMVATLSIAAFPKAATFADTEAVNTTVLLGDANDDGYVTLSDANYIQSYLQGQIMK